jgi:hypothetical protein
MRIKHFLIISILSFSAMFSLWARPISAVGMITQPLQIKDALRGQTIESSLHLVNSESENIIFELSASGEVKDWVTFFTMSDVEKPITSIELSATSSIDVGVLVKIPDDQKNGTSTGAIDTMYDPKKVSSDKDNPIAIAQKFSRPVSIEITDKEIISFSALAMPISYEVELGKPLEIKLIYTNKGNIAIRPQADIKIKNEEGEEIFGAIFPYPEKEDAVKPLGTKEILIPYNTGDLSVGQYRAEVIVSLRGEEKYRDDFAFSILDKNVVAPEPVPFYIEYKDLLILSAEILLVFVIIAVFIIGRRRSQI